MLGLDKRAAQQRAEKLAAQEALAGGDKSKRGLVRLGGLSFGDDDDEDGGRIGAKHTETSLRDSDGFVKPVNGDAGSDGRNKKEPR